MSFLLQNNEIIFFGPVGRVYSACRVVTNVNEFIYMYLVPLTKKQFRKITSL